MKTKKSAVSAALKPTDTKTTSAAPKATVAAPKTVASASSVANAASAAPKAAKAPVSRKPAAIETAPAPVAPAAAKSTTAAKPAPAPKPAAAPKSTTTTTIEVKIDVGYGNAVYLRGQGSGLNWERGVPLSCVDGATWRWSQPVSSPVTFKVLLNDQVWSTGGDLVVEPGQKIEVSPSFS